MNILDLPIQKQEELAKKQGLSLAVWQIETKAELEASKKYVDNLTTIRLEGIKAEQYKKDNPRFFEPVG